VESRLLGFPGFPYSVISMACFGNAVHKSLIAEALLGNRNPLSDMPSFMTERSNAFKMISVSRRLAIDLSHVRCRAVR